jgi:hypothetical protein
LRDLQVNVVRRPRRIGVQVKKFYGGVEASTHRPRRLLQRESDEAEHESRKSSHAGNQKSMVAPEGSRDRAQTLSSWRRLEFVHRWIADGLTRLRRVGEGCGGDRVAGRGIGLVLVPAD